MTVGIGLRSAGGVILGADTKITYGTDSKTYGSKFAYSPSKVGGYSLLMCGAGCLDSMELFFQALTRNLDRCKKEKTVVRVRIEKSLRDFHVKHIYPNRAYHNPDDIIQLLIAFRGRDGKIGFWRTEEASLLDVEDSCESIGSGANAADYFSALVYRPNMPDSEAIIVATEILRKTKGFHPQCGGESELYMLRADGAISSPLAGSSLVEIDNYLAGCDKAARNLIVQCGDVRLSRETVDKLTSVFCETVGGLRRQLESPLARTLRDLFGNQ